MPEVLRISFRMRFRARESDPAFEYAGHEQYYRETVKI